MTQEFVGLRGSFLATFNFEGDCAARQAASLSKALRNLCSNLSDKVSHVVLGVGADTPVDVTANGFAAGRGFYLTVVNPMGVVP